MPQTPVSAPPLTSAQPTAADSTTAAATTAAVTTLSPGAYTVRRPARSSWLQVRGLRLHLLHWGDASLASTSRPPLVLLHGWMDVAASFQFLADALDAQGDGPRWLVALDWRGFGLSQPSGNDSYWFPDYLADLDAVLDQLVGQTPVDLLGHSMGANVAMLYAGVRPQRLRRLVSLEGFGMPGTEPDQAPGRYARWLDELREPARLRGYPDLAAVAARLRKTNPLLRADRADWLAAHWAQQAASGEWEILGDPAHKRVNPVLYQEAEARACWQRISAPTLFVEGDGTDLFQRWQGRFVREDFEARLAAIPQVERQVLAPAGHMLHHDQPEALAAHLSRFLAG